MRLRICKLFISFVVMCCVAQQAKVTTQHPSLTLTLTQDMTLYCSMADFQRKPDMKVNTLQISVNYNPISQSKEIILASVEMSKKASASPELEKERVKKVAGKFNNTDVLSSWLEVVIADVNSHSYAAYTCSVLYADDSAESSNKNKSYVIKFVPTTAKPTRESGFSLRLDKGLNLECNLHHNHTVIVHNISFHNKRHALARWSEDNSNSFCLANVQCCTVHSLGSYTGMMVHMYGITNDDDQTVFSCNVGSNYVSKLASSWQRLTVVEHSESSKTSQTAATNTDSVHDGKNNKNIDCACVRKIWHHLVWMFITVVVCISTWFKDRLFNFIRVRAQRLIQFIQRIRESRRGEPHSGEMLVPSRDSVKVPISDNFIEKDAVDTGAVEKEPQSKRMLPDPGTIHDTGGEH